MILAIVISAITAVKQLPSHFDAINTSNQLWYWLCNGRVLVTIMFISYMVYNNRRLSNDHK